MENRFIDDDIELARSGGVAQEFAFYFESVWSNNRKFKIRKITTIITLYNTFVGLKLEYETSSCHF